MNPININQISAQLILALFILLGGLHSMIYHNLNTFGYLSILLFFATIFYCFRYSASRLDSVLHSKSIVNLNYIDLIIPFFIPVLFCLFFEYSVIDFTLDKEAHFTLLGSYLNEASNNNLGFWMQYSIIFILLLFILGIGILIIRHLKSLKNNTNGEYEKVILSSITTWFFFYSIYAQKILINIGPSFLVLSGIQLGMLYWIVKFYIPKNEYRFDKNYLLIIALSILISIIYISIYYLNGYKISDLITITVFNLIIFQRHYSDTKKLRELNQLSFDSITSKLDLQNLKSSLNPAFLLTSLKKIGVKSAQENAQLTATGVNKLIGMMHHLLYVSKDDLIPIELELIHLNNYIDFQLMRHSKNEEINIKIEIDNTLKNIHVPPMVFLPFVENAFKYGISYNNPSRIHVRLSGTENTIKFEIYNTKHKNLNSAKLSSTNIGIENTKKRLDLLFPDTHSLVIKDRIDYYLVELTIN